MQADLPYYGLAKIYRDKGDLQKYEEYLEISYSKSKNQNFERQKHLNVQLRRLKVELDKFEEAYHILDQYVALADSVNNQEITRQATKMATEYEFDKERSQLQFAQEKTELELQTASQQRYIFPVSYTHLTLPTTSRV